MSKIKELNKRDRTLAGGETLFDADEQASSAFLVRDGVLLVVRSSPCGKEVITSVYFPGEICAGLCVLTGSSYSETVRAPRKGRTVVTPLSRGDLADLLAEDPDLYKTLLVAQQQKQRYRDRMLLGRVSESCRQRTASALLWIHQQTPSEGPVSRAYLCRQELADLIGSTAETVIRILSKFRKKGLVQEFKDRIRIDVPKLEQLALGF
jgi:CRP-like cAMP-binding protein